MSVHLSGKNDELKPDYARGFTAGAAYAAFAEDRLGIIRTGMQADLTLVDRDLFRASPQELLKSRVVMTIIAGKIAFENPGS